jgi:hypothetical protein
MPGAGFEPHSYTSAIVPLKLGDPRLAEADCLNGAPTKGSGRLAAFENPYFTGAVDRT